LLAVRLLHEKTRGNTSAWAPYLAALPVDLSDSPVLWTATDVTELLVGVVMGDDALSLRRSIDSSFSLLSSVCFKVS